MLKLVDISKGEQVALFNNIGIEISSKCNRHCYFCPNGYFSRVDEQMPTDLVVKILQQLQTLKYKGRLEWYIYNEPTRDPRLGSFIKMARNMLPAACQMINTNGDYFKGPDDIWVLFEMGLNQMQINVYSAQDESTDKATFENGVRLARKREAQLQQWLDLLLSVNQDISLYQHIGAKKRAAQVVAKYGVQRTVDDSDVKGPNHFSNRSGNIPGFRGVVAEPLAKHCTRPFRFLNINWTGDAILCCNDYYGQTNFGNVKDTPLVDIWNSVNFNIYRLKLQNKKRDCFLCHNCDYKGGFYPHMTDHVTFGPAEDADILATDLTFRESIFSSPDEQGTPVEQQGKLVQH